MGGWHNTSMYNTASAAELPLPRSNTWLSCASLRCFSMASQLSHACPARKAPGDHEKQGYAVTLWNTDEAV